MAGSVAGTRHDAVVKAWESRKRLHAVTTAVTEHHATPKSREEIVRDWMAAHTSAGRSLVISNAGQKPLPNLAQRVAKANAGFAKRPETPAYVQRTPHSVPRPPKAPPSLPKIPAPGDNAFRVHHATEMVNHENRYKKLGRELQKGF